MMETYHTCAHHPIRIIFKQEQQQQRPKKHRQNERTKYLALMLIQIT